MVVSQSLRERIEEVLRRGVGEVESESLNAEHAQTERLIATSPPTIRDDPRYAFSRRGELLTQFATDSSNWSVIRGSKSIESTDTFRGQDVLNVQADSDEIRLRWNLSSQRDISSLSFAATAKALDITGNDYIDFRLQCVDTNGNQRWYKCYWWQSDDGWMTKDLSMWKEDNGFDPTTVERFDVQTSPRDINDHLWHSLRMVEQPQEAYVTVIVDDANDTDFDMWRVFQEYDVPVTFAVQTGRFGLDGSLTLDEAKTMYHEGAEFINHSYLGGSPDWVERSSQGNQYTEEEYHETVMKGKYDLERWDIGSSSHMHIYGGGAYDPKTIDIVSDYAIWDAYNVNATSVSPIYYTNPYTQERVFFDDGLSNAKTAIDLAAQYGGAVHLGGHTIQHTESDWHDLASYISNADITPATVRELVEINHSHGAP